MRHRLVRLAALGALLAGLTVGALLLHVPGADSVGSPVRVNIFVAVVCVSVGVYFLAVRHVLSGGGDRSALWIVLAVAVLVRAAPLLSPPFLSSDIYRYVWDGKVQAAGINPYRYIPDDPALAPLHDADIHPHVNRREYAPTIYPPAAQAIFALLGQVTASVLGFKLAMLAFEAAAIACLLRLLAMAGLPRERVLIYAWNPLPVWSFALDGHVDAIAVGFLALALLARARHRYGLGGALLAVATLVKFMPIAVAPAFVRGGPLWKPAIAGVLVIVALYLPYLSVGTQVFGFLSSYGGEEGYSTGTGYWLLAGLAHLVPMPDSVGRIYALVGGAGFAALSLWIAWGKRAAIGNEAIALCRDTAILAAAATVISNPHYPWYYAWLALPCAVAPIPAVIWLSAAPVVLYIDPFGERFVWTSLVFVPAIVLALHAAWRRRQAVGPAPTR